jgi:hypothetical protein
MGTRKSNNKYTTYFLFVVIIISFPYFFGGRYSNVAICKVLLFRQPPTRYDQAEFQRGNGASRYDQANLKRENESCSAAVLCGSILIFVMICLTQNLPWQTMLGFFGVLAAANVFSFFCFRP